jgi:acyl-CoA thioesterase I
MDYRNVRNKYAIIISLIFTLLFSAFYIYESPIKGKVLCFGDSITHGAGSEENGWVEQINKKSDSVTFINAGRNGRKTSDKKQLLPILKKYQDIDYVLFLLGVNDLKDGNDSMVETCVNNMQWMIDRVREKNKNIKIVIMAPCSLSFEKMSELNKKKKYNTNTEKSLIKLGAKYKELAAKNSAWFIDLFNTVSLKNFLDGVHPNTKGYKQISDVVWKRLNEIFK